MPRKFQKDHLASVEDALEAFLLHVRPIARTYKVELDYADNRVLSADVVASQDYPHYDRSFMDGYAVLAEDTTGGGALLRPSGDGNVGPGQCRWVHTGSALPAGANAVVPVEETADEPGGIRVSIGARPGDNYTSRGAILRAGDHLFPAGLQLKPTNIALLATMGMASVEVYEKPRVLIIPTGDELIERGRKAGPENINESNGLMCQLLVRRYGGKPSVWDIVPDDLEKLTGAVRAGLGYDLIVTTGGTSVGVRDLMPQIVASMGKVVVHGVGIRPGRPVGMGYVEEGDRRTPIIFLPGFPDACAISAMLFVGTAVRKLGRYPPARYVRGTAVMSGNGPGPKASCSVVKVCVRDGRATSVGTVGPAPFDGDFAYVFVPENDGGLRDGDSVDFLYLE
ncbi:MAG: molybdopterin biosynthesis protein MoeA [Methanocella sp. PtaU1.Bin125]|nr:MAG: molybdopterin biosynthesis protein MoeA [Methanocella sp. PtaU1.Bin125]